MGKALDRVLRRERGPGTPVIAKGRTQKKTAIGKQRKQLTLAPFLRTSGHAQETPIPCTGIAVGDDISIAEFEQLNLRTHKKPHLLKSVGDTPAQGRPAVREPLLTSPSDNGGEFVISASQTYERTQPEPRSESMKAGCEDVGASLRHTQPYDTAHTTQPYSSYQREGPLPAGAAANSTAQGGGALATSTAAAAAWMAPAAEAPGLGGRGPALRLPAAGCTLQAASRLDQPSESTALATGACSGVLAAACSSGTLQATLEFQALLPSVASAGPAVTPELPACGGIGCAAGSTADNGATPPPQVGLPLFPIFNQGRTRRRVFLVRHGESEYNLACMRRGGFAEPNDIFDARLTPKGEKQARGLRPQIFDLMQQHGDPLFVVSPLSRAIETFLHMLPHPERLHARGPAAPEGHAQRQEPGAATAGGGCRGALDAKPLNVMIAPLMSEILLTTGDVGRPRSALLEAYPQIAEALKKGLDRERWWFENASKGPNCSIAKVLSAREPDKAAKARVDRFRHFLLSEPHQPVIVVGHANFFKNLMHESCYMKNCQIVTWAL